MTLFVLEGISASGKSTVRDKLLERNPEWIKWKGENLMRKGPGDHWKEYQRRYHESLHRLYELNPENVIIADRAFSDYAYNTDDQFRKEMGRLFACYGDVYVLYFTPSPLDSVTDIDDWISNKGVAIDQLRRRGSRDAGDIDRIRTAYRALLMKFDHKVFDTLNNSEEETALSAEAFIRETHEQNRHNPDI